MKLQLNYQEKLALLLAAYTGYSLYEHFTLQALLTLLILLAGGLALHLIISKLRKTPPVPAATLNNLLILFLLLSPAEPLFLFVATLGTLFFTHYPLIKDRPLAYPAVLGIVAAIGALKLLTGTLPEPSWWGIGSAFLPYGAAILIFLLLAEENWIRYPAFFAFLIAHILLTLLDTPNPDIYLILTDGTLYFVAGVLLLNPAVSPTQPVYQILYSIAAALGLHFLPPLFAIITANLFFHLEDFFQKATATLRHVLKISLGIILIILGLIGWLIPIIPGWPLLIPGLFLIAPEYAHSLKGKIQAFHAHRKKSRGNTKKNPG